MKMKDQKRNLNPTAEGILAMNLYSKEYGGQRGGSMDFWDKLDDVKKSRVREILNKIKERIGSK